MLRMASEEPDTPKDEERRELTPARDGLTLAQIREIALEVGIDPDRVSRAVAMLPQVKESGLIRLWGGILLQPSRG